jgi:transposase-like protein
LERIRTESEITIEVPLLRDNPPAQYKIISEKVVAFYELGKSRKEIANILGVSWKTTQKALKWIKYEPRE